MKKLLNALLCHNVLIVFCLFMVTAFIFRGELFGLGYTVKPEPASTEEMPAIAAPLANPRQAQPEPETKAEPVPASQEAPEVESVASTPALEAVTPPKVADQVETAEVAVTRADISPDTNQVSPGETEKTAEPVVQFPESAKDTPEKFVEQNDYQFRPEDSPSALSDEVEMDLLQKARQAYWNDDLEKSKNLYQAYIELNPENPDGYGELGNLLSTLGDLDSAANMYGKAADLLIRQGEHAQAAKLMDVLDSIEVIQKAAK